MKILMINDYATDVAGAEKYLFSLKKKLIENGNEVVVLSSDINAPPHCQDVFTFQTNQNKIDNLLAKIFNLRSFFETKKLIKKFGPDIIHLHSINDYISPSVIIAAKNIPVLMTLHDYSIICPNRTLFDYNNKMCTKQFSKHCSKGCINKRNFYYEYVRRKISNFIFKKVDLFIAPSQFLFNKFYENGYKNVKLIYNAVKMPLLDSKIIDQSNILCVGRLTFEKGFSYVIEAMPKILLEYPDMQLNIIGTGPYEDDLKNLVEQLNIEKNVIFHGRVLSLDSYYLQTKILIVPSIWAENCSMVVLEGLSHGIPLILTNVGGNPELIDNEKSGLLIEKMNSDEIAKNVIKILSNESLENKIKHESRKIACTKYNMEKHAEIIYLTYKITTQPIKQHR